jgi:hypothetical protein
MIQINLIEQHRKQCFIEKAKKVHGDTYGYEGVIYKNNKTKIIISCRIHKEFQQEPSSHLAGCGCPKCGIESRSRKKRLSVVDFITKAEKIHERKYDYSEIRSLSPKSKVLIKCPEHGVFTMDPWNHLAGQGCRECGISKRANKCRSNRDEFIAKARRIHGSRYDYDHIDYLNAKTSVLIKCEKHGFFEQVPDTHLRGSGCKKCTVEQRGKLRELGMGTHIERARKKHNNFYDYALVPSEGPANRNVQINCPMHKIFSQNFYQHSRGLGCPKCWNERRNMRRKEHEEFVHDAQKKHGMTYDYSKTDYINAYTKIKIICAIHGLFEITPTKHLSRGDGCPECGFLKRKGIGGISESRLKKDPALSTVDAWIYIAHMDNSNESFYKFGITTNKYPENRYSFFNAYNCTIERAVSISLCEAKILESELKRSLEEYRPKIKFSGYTECTLEDPWPLLIKLLRK